MSDVTVTVVGHVGKTPTLMQSEKGTKWTAFSVASTRRVRDNDGWRDGETTWFRVKAFGDRASNAAATLNTGTPVVVTGRLTLSDYQVTRVERCDDGCEITVNETRVEQVIDNATIAVDITRGTARYSRTMYREAGASDGVSEADGATAVVRVITPADDDECDDDEPDPIAA
jgi:single-strand DNA-binding protein